MRQCPSKKDAHGAATQQCKSILETIMIQQDNDVKLKLCHTFVYMYANYHDNVRNKEIKRECQHSH